jgi:hypothetical protein
MQQYPLLQTKLHIPPTRPDPSTAPLDQLGGHLRARLVSRPRLAERLNTCLVVSDALRTCRPPQSWRPPAERGREAER